MTNYNGTLGFELIYIVVNYGMGSKVLRKAKECGICGGTIFLGRGTVRNSLLNFLSLYDERKEIVLIGADSITSNEVISKLNEEFRFEKPNHGILFTTNVCEVKGSNNCKSCASNEERGGMMYQNIITIVNRGRAEEVIDAAQSAGSKGGTIVNARGSGIHETRKLFNMDVEPEKEMVIILSKRDTTDSIIASIREKLDIDKPGNGIIFVQDIHQSYGIYE